MSDVRSAAELRQLIDGYRNSALLYVAAKLGLADLLADAPSDSQVLARSLQVNEAALHRVLRGLAVLRVVGEGVDGKFALTELGANLRVGATGSLRDWALLAGEEYIPAWGALLHSVQTGEAAFDRVFAMNVWEHRRRNPQLAASFNKWLGEQSASVAQSILQAYDLSAAREIVDVGGGEGAILFEILKAHPRLRGVLLDLPPATAEAEAKLQQLGFAKRCRTHAGDFFQAIPEGGDVYLLKSVLHDWDDERCEQILGNCRKAMSGSSRLLVVERVIPERASDDPATVMLDLHMLAVLGGRERTLHEYRRLGVAAGLKLRQSLASGAGFELMEFVAA